MISLKEGEHAQKICDYYDESGKKQTVWFHQRAIPELRNVIESVGPILKDPEFRDQFDLSTKDIELLTTAIENETVPEDSKLRKKYFRTKKKVESLGLSEMNIQDTSGKFEINISDNKKDFEGAWQITSASQGGKTHWFKELVKRHWENVPKGKRRPLVMVSTEETIDRTLHDLKRKRFADWYVGVDVSQDAFQEWQDTNNKKSADDWYNDVIKPVLKGMDRNTMLCGDDLEDSPAYIPLHREFERLIRVGRHKGISPVFFINHRILSGWYGKQLGNTVRYRILFPRSSKHKLIQWLNTHVSLSLNSARNLVNRVVPHSRWLAIRMTSPVCAISEKYIKLL